MRSNTGDPQRRRRNERSAGLALAVALGLVVAPGAASATDPPANAAMTFKVVDDGIPEPLASAAGDAARGRSLILARDPANCVLCHAIPDAGLRFAGDVGPPLGGVGARLSVAQLRLRVADILRLHPSTIMPSYYRVEGLSGVAPAYAGKPILSAPEIEDVVAYLATLR